MLWSSISPLLSRSTCEVPGFLPAAANSQTLLSRAKRAYRPGDQWLKKIPLLRLSRRASPGRKDRPRIRIKPLGRLMARRRGMLTLDELRERVDAGTIDTVLVAITDMQGRLQGKRCSAEDLLDEGVGHATEACNYLLAVD